MTDEGIKAQIDAAFRKARLERDEPTKTVIGMLKSKVLLELKSGSGATEDDDLWLRTITAYAKAGSQDHRRARAAGPPGCPRAGRGPLRARVL